MSHQSAPLSTLLDADSAAGEVARELARRGADSVAHARGSLAQHLVGVRAILVRWEQPERVQLAGLVHSGYSTEAYRFRLFGRSDRARVRELVGPEAERLVFAFCACKRDALWGAVEEARRTRGPVSVPTRWGNDRVRLAPRELGELMVIHAANLVEQTCFPRGAPRPCLARVSRFLVAARAAVEKMPLVLDRGAQAVTTAHERSLLRAYRRILSPVREPRAGSFSKADLALLTSSPVGEPLVLLALQALADRRAVDAVQLGERARDALAGWGVAWDKRLRLARWEELANFVVRDGAKRDRELDLAARRAANALAAARGSPARLWAQLDALTAFAASAPPARSAPRRLRSGPSDALPPRFARYVSGLRSNAERPLLQFYPGLRAQPWYDPRDFAIVADLERLAPTIAAEAKGFDTRSFQDEAENIERVGRWALFLLEMGRRNEANLARCPALRSVIERHRTLTTHAGLMYFSCLEPGTRVAPHQGPTNIRLRCHLGLEVPANCGIRVGGATEVWQEGRCLVFDDSFRHEVWNDSARRRVVLVLDLWHPDLEDEEVALLAGLHRYGAANQRSTERYWARNEAAQRRGRAASPESTLPDPPDPLRALEESVGVALRAGDLQLASERAARYASLCRGTRWYPVRREDDPELPASVPWAPVLTPAKLLHDIEQLDYLKERGILTEELTPIIRAYDGLLDTLRPLGDEARVPLLGTARAEIGHVYNRLIHVRPAPRVPRALSGEWSPAAVEDEYFDRRPHSVVVDRFLSPDAIESLRLFCLESTIWSTNRYDHGRLGSFFRDGFNSPLLVQIAEELRAALPRILGARHPVTQLWGYKYASTQPSLPPHADFAAVNVNLWITPDEANLAPGSGGLDLYDVEAPKDWDFPTYNRNAGKIRELLAARGARPREIPYGFNRAVIFDSDLFHATPALTFRPGYESRRINVTALFGDRHRP